MAALSSKPNHVRSISFPGRSHPTIQRVEEELNKLKSLEAPATPKADTVYNGLLILEKLYKSIDDLLNLPTLQTLSQSLDAEWVDDLLDKSVRLLDVCGTTRELVSQYKGKVRDLQSSLRRRKGDSTTDDSIERFTSFSKKIKRDAKTSVLTLKQTDQETAVPILLDEEQDTMAAIRALREANAVCISIFQMLLSFLCVPLLKPKQSKWSLLSRLVHKERIAPEVQEENKSLETKLETFEAYLDSFENALEAVFSWLVSFHIYNVHGKLNSLPFDLLVVPHGAPWLAIKCIVPWTGLLDFAEPTYKCVCACVRDLQSCQKEKRRLKYRASFTRGAQKLFLVLTI
ncbi:hypothetical protein H5410_008446 [Solanum commersonii]|uniref:Uncharacterized protein n=1 Tax=Solanum commersonii TaxID=4109 RepID=A0A9J6AG11_SOLCO|nr:hypothetical protein H5410_008446 [Solanum commersonii]